MRPWQRLYFNPLPQGQASFRPVFRLRIISFQCPQLAARGIPISTTHALVGGMVGAGVVAAGSDLNLTKLGQSFLLAADAARALVTSRFDFRTNGGIL